MKERKTPTKYTTIPCADQRQERRSDKLGYNINLCNTILETPRLSLIPVTKIASIHETLSDPFIATFKGLNACRKEFESFGYGLWAIQSNEPLVSGYPKTYLHFTDDFNFRLPPSSTYSPSSPSQASIPIGYIHLSQKSFINIGIATKFTSQGYATEALKKLLSVIFDIDLCHVAHVKVENDAMARVVEKLGFKEKEPKVFSIRKSEFNDLWNSIDDYE